MTFDKAAVAFHELDFEAGWEPAPGAAPGIEQKLLSGALDEAACSGVRTRLIRFQPGAFTDAPFVHEYWEEVYLVSGDLTDDGVDFQPAAYACRPPGTPHGPFRSESGCLFFEIQYYI